MADNDDEIEDIYGEKPEDDIDTELRKQIEKLTADDDEAEDDGGFDAPLETTDASATVSQDEGLDLAEQARLGRGKKADAETKPEPDPDAKSEAHDPPATPAAGASSLESADTTALLDGLDEPRRIELTRRLDAASRITGLFKGHEAELQMHGATPETAVQRFLDLNRFAQERPDEYVAWVATQTGGKEPQKVLEKAAERLGFKLVPNAEDNDDDDFLTPEAKALKEENARLKAQLTGRQPQFGPDTPERVQARQAQQQLSGFVTARDPQTGQPLRPHFERLRPRIAELATAHVRDSQKPVTVDDLQRFYSQAEAEVREIAGVANTSAAQAAPSVADQIKTQAAAAAKAKAASKSIDGTGQGASRRPALPDDAPLETVIRHFAQQGQG